MVEPEKLRLRIESLALEGLDPATSGAVVGALRAALERLILNGESHALPRASTTQLDGGAIHLEPSASATATGALIASAIYRGLTSGGTRA